jgi:Gram-negative bacterial TonB protein C-terminal
MKITLFLLFLLYANTTVFAQADTSKIYTFVETKPEHPGGERALLQYLMDNIRVTQDCDLYNERILFEFIIEKDGYINQVSVKKGEQRCKEVLLILCQMACFKPGMQNGKPVRVRYTLPLSFHCD